MVLNINSSFKKSSVQSLEMFGLSVVHVKKT